MKIDVTQIEGYADMTPEEKLAALEAVDFQVPEIDMSKYVSKELFDKASSETAEWKRKHNALLSEEERKQAERDEEIATLKREAEAYKLERQLAEIKGSYLSIGYDEALADDTARAVIEGDHLRTAANLKKFLGEYAKSIETNLIAKTPRPDGTGAASTGKAWTKDEIIAIQDPEKRKALIKENPTLFGLPES